MNDNDEISGIVPQGTLSQWTLLAIVSVVVVFAFLILVGDEDPRQPLNITEFLLVKAAALSVLYVCYLVIRWGDHKGLFPNFKEDKL